MAQEIIKLKNDISEAFCAEGEIIGEINEDKNQKINNMCKVWTVPRKKRQVQNFYILLKLLSLW